MALVRFFKGWYDNLRTVGSVFSELKLSGNSLELYRLIRDEYKPKYGETCHTLSRDIKGKECIAGYTNPLFKYTCEYQLTKLEAEKEGYLILTLMNNYNSCFYEIELETEAVLQAINESDGSVRSILSSYMVKQIDNLNDEIYAESRRKDLEELNKVKQRFK
ncbi:hypothetical protein [Pseudoalteromonas sp. OOF1S-7]|uniref:hypothetical protein n=1 Tax=Pseudoalteromonas sp. OOF1S-7 TaxID=2917757 RepID=UPI001EF5A990|nr:hypothetical protein [Pseudoalteromonas sp. OOF1S-7]MCG7537099.1 hypothetical protein [Pseudoalteromonas sp. OOF1S-7]